MWVSDVNLPLGAQTTTTVFLLRACLTRDLTHVTEVSCDCAVYWQGIR